MIIQYCSDLHLEFPENKEFLKTNPLQAKAEILLLAGDIVPLVVMNKHNDFFDYVSDNFKHTYWIPGNHEYYYYDITKKDTIINEKIRSNVHLVNNFSVKHNDVKLIFSTLWSKINPANQWNIRQRISDFHVIKHGKESFTPTHFNELHKECLQFIEQEVEQNEKTIVASHHIPSFLNYPEKYKGDVLNQAFAVELYDFIENSNINYWLFGHHHQNVSDFTIGKTKLITNQLGYVKYREQKGYDGGKTIEI
ncbi:MAG: metallophosphoesterase [Saprospiraceae bacterium]|nr:metallophosphoesterase [Saprospiraceae bacterium]